MATPSPHDSPEDKPDNPISIDVTNDLESASALVGMLASEPGAIFRLIGELTKYAPHPISKAAKANASAAVNLNGTVKWNIPNGITFSLTPEAKCAISVSEKSKVFPVAMSVDSPTTTDVSVGPVAGQVYVNIELDFDIKGSASGSGTVGAVGIAGKASGSASKTFVYCQPVDAAANTVDAIKRAFSGLVFPLDPGCASSMKPGCIAKVAFDGSFDCELDVTYGLGNYKVSAPSLGSVQESLKKVATLTPASLEAKVGVKGSITYSHADHFAMIVNKSDDADATLYLVRSDENDWGASVGVSAGVTVTSASVSIEPAAIQAVAGEITGNSALASSVASAASSGLNNLGSSLSAKLNNWVSQQNGVAGLSVSLKRQKGHTALFTFQVNLKDADLAAQSWSALVTGSIFDALRLKGFTLQPGSGVADNLKRACTLQFHFFNLFSFSSTSDYFNNAYTELGPDGTIRIFSDIGQERDDETKKKIARFRIHFTATATKDALDNVSGAVVDLYIEISEKGRPELAAGMERVMTFVPVNASVQSAQAAMAAFTTKAPAASVALICVITQSGYRKVSATAYNGSRPTPLPHGEDQSNWTAFQNASEVLMPQIGFVRDLNFTFWMNYNRACIDRIGSTMTPDRRHRGDPGAVPDSFFAAIGSSPGLIKTFLDASGGFMNLCEDLQFLAKAASEIDCIQQWNTVLKLISTVVSDDVSADYTKATAGALLRQCSIGGAETTATVEQSKNSLTCTLTLA